MAAASGPTAATGSPVPGMSASLSAGTYIPQVMRPHVTFTLDGHSLCDRGAGWIRSGSRPSSMTPRPRWRCLGWRAPTSSVSSPGPPGSTSGKRSPRQWAESLVARSTSGRSRLVRVDAAVRWRRRRPRSAGHLRASAGTSAHLHGTPRRPRHEPSRARRGDRRLRGVPEDGGRDRRQDRFVTALYVRIGPERRADGSRPSVAPLAGPSRDQGRRSDLGPVDQGGGDPRAACWAGFHGVNRPRGSSPETLPWYWRFGCVRGRQVAHAAYSKNGRAGGGPLDGGRVARASYASAITPIEIRKPAWRCKGGIRVP